MSFGLLDLILYSLCIMTFIWDILYYSMFENVVECNIKHNVIMWEICFEKSEAFNSFINDISKSRNRDFCYRKVEKHFYTPLKRQKTKAFQEVQKSSTENFIFCTVLTSIIVGTCITVFSKIFSTSFPRSQKSIRC